MKLKFDKKKIPPVIVLLVCFTLIAIFSDYSGLSVQTSGKIGAEKKVIVLDAGHGGMDSGAVGIHGEYEKDINLAIVMDLKQLLEFSGFNVVLTRDSDVSIHDKDVTGTRNQKVSDMENRLNIIKSYSDCIFISIHQNKFTDSKYFGAQMFYNNNNPNNQLLAQLMQDCFGVLQPENDRQIKLTGDELYLFKTTMTPSVLIECGFLSNENDANNLSDSEYQKRVAFTIYGGLVKYLQLTVDDEQDTSSSKESGSESKDSSGSLGLPDTSVESKQEGNITTNGEEQSSLCLQ